MIIIKKLFSINICPPNLIPQGFSLFTLPPHPPPKWFWALNEDDPQFCASAQKSMLRWCEHNLKARQSEMSAISST